MNTAPAFPCRCHVADPIEIRATVQRDDGSERTVARWCCLTCRGVLDPERPRDSQPFRFGAVR